MLAKNEYSQLKSVIVGDATDARIPALDKSLRCVNYADKVDTKDIPAPGLYPPQVIDEANEDIDIFIEFLKEQNIKVLRPEKNKPAYYNYCPRDVLFTYGDKIIFAPMSIRARQNEYLAYTKLLPESLQTTMKITREDSLYNESCIDNKEVLALNETEPCFDAANVLRHNQDVFYLVSNSGNLSGANSLQNFLGRETKVHVIENVYSYMHLDSTMAILRDGLLLVNPDRIKDKMQLPKVLQNWDIISAPQPIDIGHYPGHCNSSPWVSMNLLSVNENLVVLEQKQDNLRKLLESYKIECAMLPMRHARTLGGCFHCITVDVERE